MGSVKNIDNTAPANVADSGDGGQVTFPLRDAVPPLIFERSRPGRPGVSVPGGAAPDSVGEAAGLLPEEMRRESPPALPEVPEHEVVRHFVQLSLLNHHVDRGFYPLGSCTMKHNPKINEAMTRLPGFTGAHPLAPSATVQGALQLQWELGQALCEISGMDDVTLQPAAGAHGELAAVFMMRAYHEARGDQRTTILIPDTAHGTNPATVALAGYETVALPSDDDGLVDVEALKAALGDHVAGFMVTNPNTLGKFEQNIGEVAELVHGIGGLMYMDGANLNALMGIAKPGDMGFDVLHFNLHKTFSTPHGGGGPGSGPVAVKEHLARFLPIPVVERHGEKYRLEWDRPHSIGQVHGFMGNFGVQVRAFTYIRQLGASGLRAASEAAVLNNAYVSARLTPTYELPYGCGLHESVFSGRPLKRHGVKTVDVAKRLLDFGVHAPTVYFPLIVPEALLIEPTETETREELDRFVDVMLRIAQEAAEDPELVTSAPHNTPRRRLDQGAAARNPDVRWCGG